MEVDFNYPLQTSIAEWYPKEKAAPVRHFIEFVAPALVQFYSLERYKATDLSLCFLQVLLMKLKDVK